MLLLVRRGTGRLKAVMEGIFYTPVGAGQHFLFPCHLGGHHFNCSTFLCYWGEKVFLREASFAGNNFSGTPIFFNNWGGVDTKQSWACKSVEACAFCSGVLQWYNDSSHETCWCTCESFQSLWSARVAVQLKLFHQICFFFFFSEEKWKCIPWILRPMT